MPKIPQKTQTTIWVISISIGVAMGVIAALIFANVFNLHENITASDFIAIGILLTIAPPSVAFFIDNNWRTGIDTNLPNLLRDIADAQRTGLSLPRAVTESSKRNYGPLTPELQKMAAKISWGIPFDQAMRSFTETADTELNNRAAILILEAQRSGGVIEDIFDSAQKHVEDILALRKERLGQMKPYIWIIYAAFIIFLLVIVVLFNTFFYPMAEMYTEFQGNQFANMGLNPQVLESYKILFLHMTIVEGLFSGLVAGKMGEGKAKSGLKHSSIMVLIGWITYKLTIELQLIEINM
ncbi:MAG: type II secretion system F family protein [Candidatus Heimdallarchaeota archaeon]|nr:type II secretion system F family protein [Candidatus Heimdallarchaeota archaeon]MCG3252469.1 type II secretion system F family protein [Candidatus Heimdallarchaeota archaeon]MCK4289607.1 type II secretion system F family protein [Candidatus Heimdallarchaeota archaeon]